MEKRHFGFYSEKFNLEDSTCQTLYLRHLNYHQKKCKNNNKNNIKNNSDDNNSNMK